MLHNSQKPFFRFPQGPVPCNTTIELNFFSTSAKKVYLRTWDGREKKILMKEIRKNIYFSEIVAPSNPCLFWYDFIIEKKDNSYIYYANNPKKIGGKGHIYENIGPSFQITVYDNSFITPDFLKEGSMYQIFPDRFFRHRSLTKDIFESSPVHHDSIIHDNWYESPIYIKSNRSQDNKAIDFFGGTLKGIEEKLEYIKDLGISIIYLNPIFEAHSNHRYDTGDYTKTDPILGDNDDFISLCRKAKKMGMHIILDGVFSHTGEDSKYFNKYEHYESDGAYNSTDSPYFSWYKFTNLKKEEKEYKSWWNIPTLPEINENHPSYQNFIFDHEAGIVPKWINMGASGWRLDVVDELDMEFVRNLRDSTKAANLQSALIGEVWEDASNKVSYGKLRSYCLGDTLDSVMNYPLRDAIIAFLLFNSHAEDLAGLINHQKEVYPLHFFYSLMNLIGSHDRARIVNILAECTHDNIPIQERGNKSLTDQQLKIGKLRLIKAFEIICSLPGIPTIYYGDEAGLEGAADPFNRETFKWGQEDLKLKETIKFLFKKRKDSHVLKYGLLNVFAIDKNTIRIVRYIKDGKDAFGKITKQEHMVIDINREI